MFPTNGAGPHSVASVSRSLQPGRGLHSKKWIIRRRRRRKHEAVMWKRNALSAAKIFFRKRQECSCQKTFPSFFLYVQVIQLLFASYLSFFFSPRTSCYTLQIAKKCMGQLTNLYLNQSVFSLSLSLSLFFFEHFALVNGYMLNSWWHVGKPILLWKLRNHSTTLDGALPVSLADKDAFCPEHITWTLLSPNLFILPSAFTCHPF